MGAQGWILSVLAILGAVLSVHAAPAVSSHLEARQTITTLASTQIAAFKPYTHYASTAYCQPSATLTWSCGDNCNANPGFQPVASGGDGDGIQFWYVGFDPTLKTVIVAHQGTDPSEFLAVLTDANFFLGSLTSNLFSGISSSIQVHSGFAAEQAKTASTILAAVQSALTLFQANHVTVVGHSLGAALALLDGVYLSLHLPNVTLATITYGMPRVGNQAFASYVDAHLNVTHINNREDLVPIIPGRLLGFHHPSGEIHIEDSGSWVSCPGEDNTSSRCIVGDVPTIFEGNMTDHLGPYDGVEMGC